MGNALTADTQSSVQGSNTRDAPIPSPYLTDDPQHVADSVHPPPEMQVRMNLLSRLLGHAEGRDTGLAAGPTSTPWGPLSLGGLRRQHDARTWGAAATSPCPIQEAKGGSYSFTHWLLALAVSLHENNWEARWTRELVIRDKIPFRQCICFWSGLPGQQSRAVIVAEQGCFVFIYYW